MLGTLLSMSSVESHASSSFLRERGNSKMHCERPSTIVEPFQVLPPPIQVERVQSIPIA